jgi:hypothetical protein
MELIVMLCYYEAYIKIGIVYHQSRTVNMDAEEILARARSQAELPAGWVAFPIIRQKLIVGIIEWIFGIIVGLGLLLLIGSIVIPYNFQHGVARAVFSTLLLGILLFVFLGSAYLLVVDILRLAHRDQHMIVITPQEFVKQEGRKIIHVPLLYVRHVTARGRRPAAERNLPGMEESTMQHVPDARDNITGFFFGHGMTGSGRRWQRGRMRTPSTLAFLDTQHNREVLVVNDTTYGDPFLIAEVLKEAAETAQESAV